MIASPLFETPSRSVKRRLLIANILCSLLVMAGLGTVILALVDAGQFRPSYWAPFAEPGLWRTMGRAFIATLRAALYCVALSILLGVVLGVTRLSGNRWARVLTGLWIDVFRAVPSLLVILFLFLAYSRFFDQLGASVRGLVGPEIAAVLGTGQWKTLGPLVTAIVLFHGAIFAEVFRAGILAVPSGQSDAGYAIGMTRGMLLRTVLLPAAVRNMLPALITEAVRSLKATSLGYAIGYMELLRTGQLISSMYNNVLPVSLVLAVIYIALCLPLSLLGAWFERTGVAARQTTVRAQWSGASPVPAT